VFTWYLGSKDHHGFKLGENNVEDWAFDLGTSQSMLPIRTSVSSQWFLHQRVVLEGFSRQFWLTVTGYGVITVVDPWKFYSQFSDVIEFRRHSKELKHCFNQEKKLTLWHDSGEHTRSGCWSYWVAVDIVLCSLFGKCVTQSDQPKFGCKYL